MKNIAILKRCATIAVSIIIVGTVIASPAGANGSTDPVMVKDINPGSGSSGYGVITVMGSTFFFGANDGTNGIELWKSDGTGVGTAMVKDINPGSGSSVPDRLTVMGSTLFFGADDGTNGYELWKSDGTGAGTVMVKDIYPGSVGSGPGDLTVMGSTLFFRADDATNGWELWKLEAITHEVGGTALPVNKLRLLALWAVLPGCAAVLMLLVLRKKRQA